MRKRTLLSLLAPLLCLLAIGLVINGCSSYGSGSPFNATAYTVDEGGGGGDITTTLYGRVQGENGVPVSNATVTIARTFVDANGNSWTTTARTNSQGDFTATLYTLVPYNVNISGGTCGGSQSLGTVNVAFTPTSINPVRVFSKPSGAGTTTMTIPQPVTCTASARGTKATSVALSWNASSEPGFSCYRIYRSTTKGATGIDANLVTTITTQGTTGFTDTPGNAGTYYYRLYVYTSLANNLYCGAASDEVSATIDTATTLQATSVLGFYATKFSTTSQGVYALVYPHTSTGIPSGTYTVALPGGTTENLAVNAYAGYSTIVGRTYYGYPIVGSYGSKTTTEESYQVKSGMNPSPATGSYTITSPLGDAPITASQGIPSALEVTSTVNNDGTISVSWTSLGSNYRYKIMAITEGTTTPGSTETTHQARWCNVDPEMVSPINKPQEFVATGKDQLSQATSCTIPAVFTNKSKVYVQVTAYDVSATTYSAVSSTMGKMALYFSETTTGPHTIVGGPSGSGGIYALFVGINKYTDPSNDLGECVNDVNGMKESLTQSSLWNGATVETLTDYDATKTAIMSKISSLGAQAGSGSLFFFYYSGHGTNDGSQSYIVPTDASSYSGCIGANELQTALSSVSGNKCIIFDSCNSGGFVNKAKGDKVRFMRMAKSQERFSGTDFAKALEQLSNLVFMGACKGSELSVESPSLGHGAFTYYLIQGLGSGSTIGSADSNKDGTISASELFNYSSPLTTVYNPDQNPVLQNNYSGELEIKQ
ncbi:MAG: caspase family protein [Candidatus Eremiobacteraeota bacterium]|nr:caspase family protein [Candidatus Eremiobacteraeota bacterium]